MDYTTLAIASLALAFTSSVSIIASIITIFVRRNVVFQKLMIPFAVGALLGDVFIHILPEIQNGSHLSALQSYTILLGLLLFWATEKLIHWHHCHKESPKPNKRNRGQNISNLALVNLLGDGIHNLIDGIVITLTFISSHRLGIATTVAVLLHELPQELSDLSILIHSGLSKRQALLYNFLNGLASFIGLALVILFNNAARQVATTLLPIAAGGFLYIATVDLIPELRKQDRREEIIIQTLGICSGLLLMQFLKLLN